MEEQAICCDLGDVEALVHLVSEAAEPSTEAPIALRRRMLLEGVGRLIGADVWLWVTSRLHPDREADAMATNLIDGGYLNAAERDRVLSLAVDEEAQRFAFAGVAEAIRDQRFLALTRDDLVPEPAWRAHPIGKRWAESGFDHFLVAAYPLGPGVFSAISYHRRVGGPRFTERERQIVDVVYRQVDWLHRAESDVPAGPHVVHLSKRQRQVLLYLLGGESRKQIANRMSLSEHTVADHVRDLYRHFDVSSRGELLALFIGGKSATRA